MNLKAPPTRRFLAWSFRHKAAALDYIRATFFLSRLTINVTRQGRTQRIVITYSGREAEAKIPLDSLLA